MDNNVFLNDDFSKKDIQSNAEVTKQESSVNKLKKIIENAYDAAFEIDVNNNQAYEIFIKDGTPLHNEFINNKISYSRLCRLILKEMADSADIEKLTEFLSPARIKKVRLNENGKNEERLQFRVKDTSSVEWKECRIVYFWDKPSETDLFTLRNITNEKNYEIKYNAQSELIYATQNSEREIVKDFTQSVKSIYNAVIVLNYTTLECFEYEFADDEIRKKKISGDLKEYIKHLAQNSVHSDDAQKFLSFFSLGNVSELSQKKTDNIEVILKLRNSENSRAAYEWHLLTARLAKNKNGEIILTVFFKNINKSETERIKIRKSLESSLVMTTNMLKIKEQYKNALIEGSYFCINANVDKDLIEVDCEDANGNSLMKAVGLSAPCRLSDFARRWIERYVIKTENSPIDTSGFDLKVLKDNYENGNRFYKGEYKIIAATGKIRWLECYTLLVKTDYENELMMLHYALDITDEKRKKTII